MDLTYWGLTPSWSQMLQTPTDRPCPLSLTSPTWLTLPAHSPTTPSGP